MKKKKIVCSKCFRDDFKSTSGLQIHDTRKHPYIPPPPPKTKFRSFSDVARSGWGREYPIVGKLNPTDNDLIMGYLALCFEELQKLNTKLGKIFRQ